MRDPVPQPGLLHQVSRSVFWNTALLPVVTAAGLLLSVLVRRRFGLESGIYDVVLGIVNTILFYSSLGISGSLAKFLPELQVRGGTHVAARLVWQLASLRLGVLIAILIPLNIWAEPAARTLGLDQRGAVYLRWLSALLLGRGALDFAYRTLDSFLQQLSVNILALLNSVLDLVLVAVVIAIGLELEAVIGALGASALATGAVAAFVVARTVWTVPSRGDAVPAQGPSGDRIWKLSSVTYLRDLGLYFATPAFASPILLKILGGPEPVALFATSYFIAAATVGLVVSAFRGIYRPAFARVLASGDRAQLQRTFDLVNKAQVLAVVPAGVGLAVMVSDYLPLLYGEPFSAAIPLARILVILLFAETTFAVGLVVLWADEQYRPVLLAQLAMVAGAPLFVWAAAELGLAAAAIVLGSSRLASSAIGHMEANRMYELRYPWRFAAQIFVVSLAMGAILLLIRGVWGTSPIEAATLTVLGVALVAAGLRILRVIGPGDIEILERASIPGKRLLIQWLQGSGSLKV